MKLLTVQLWKLLPPAEDETPGMPCYRIAGTYAGLAFLGDIAIEIDGRDAEYTRIAGAHMESLTADIIEKMGEDKAWLEVHNAQPVE